MEGSAVALRSLPTLLAQQNTNRKEQYMTGTLVIKAMGQNETIKWDTTKNSGGPLDPIHARERFEAMMQAGGLFAFAQAAGSSTLEQIGKSGFDPETQEKVFISPQISGGCC